MTILVLAFTNIIRDLHENKNKKWWYDPVKEPVDSAKFSASVSLFHYFFDCLTSLSPGLTSESHRDQKNKTASQALCFNRNSSCLGPHREFHM